MKKQILYKSRNKPSGKGLRMVLRTRQRVLQRFDFIAAGIFIIAASAGMVMYFFFAKVENARANPHLSGEVKIQVTNEAGQTVYTETVQAGLDFNAAAYADNITLPPGTYFLNMKSSKQTFAKRVVKE